MGQRFAVKSGNWSDPTVWDDGQVPGMGDRAFANANTITIDQDIVIDTLSTDYPQQYLPETSTAYLTDITSSVSSSGYYSTGYEAWRAFSDPYLNTGWRSNTTVTGWLSYDFNSTRVIKRYYIRKHTSIYGPRSWTFEGSNDGNTWDVLETVSGNTQTVYVSGILANTTAYRYYRVNVSATAGNYQPWIYNFGMTESTGSVYGANKGGVYNITGSSDITFSGTGFETHNNTVCAISAADPDVVNIATTGSGTILNGYQQKTQSDPVIVNITGNGTINITGDLLGANFQRNGSVMGYSRTGQIYVNSSCTLNIIGNIYGTNNNNESYECPVVRLVASGATINITGNIFGSTARYNHNTIWAINNQGTINVTGNMTAYLGSCIYNASATTINHTGTVQASNNPGYPGIVSLNYNGDVNLSSPLINYQGSSAVAAFRMNFNSGSAVEWQVQDTANTNFNIYSSNVTGSTLGLPLTTNVKSGITFGPDNDLTGTLVIPSADNVRKGVAVDNTIGTAELTADDFLTAISSSNNPVATRLKNVATVQTVGEQFNVFNP